MRETVQGTARAGNLLPMSLVSNRGISFEFFPPSTDIGESNLWQAISELEQLGPDFVSVTYGAGGSTRDRTLRVTQRIKEETGLIPVAHLTCVGSSNDQLTEIIQTLLAAGVNSLMALRGDPPAGIDAQWQAHPDGMTYAVQLVELAAKCGMQHIGVAAFPDKHPQSPSLDFDVEVLQLKQQAGASFAITQLFFDAQSYLDLISRAAQAGVTIPIRPGIMPLTDSKQIAKFSQLSGTPMPESVKAYFNSATDSADIAQLGVDFATNLGAELLDAGAPGVHLYTMNKSTAAKQVFLNLKS
jgi:methylenetetrahydrofolate reductase (NADPH)